MLQCCELMPYKPTWRHQPSSAHHARSTVCRPRCSYCSCRERIPRAATAATCSAAASVAAAEAAATTTGSSTSNYSTAITAAAGSAAAIGTAAAHNNTAPTSASCGWQRWSEGWVQAPVLLCTADSTGNHHSVRQAADSLGHLCLYHKELSLLQNRWQRMAGRWMLLTESQQLTLGLNVHFWGKWWREAVKTSQIGKEVTKLASSQLLNHPLQTPFFLFASSELHTAQSVPE